MTSDVGAQASCGRSRVSRVNAPSSLKRDSANASLFGEQQLNVVGYWLLGNRRPPEALVIFQLNLEEFPRSSDAYEGVGESYLGVGDTSKAIVNLKRSLELNPKNQAVSDVLGRLGIKP